MKFRSFPILIAFLFIVAVAPVRGEYSWRRELPPRGETLHGIWNSGTENAWAVGENGAIHRYKEGSWTLVEETPSIDFQAVWGRSPASVWAAGLAGRIAHWDGDDWEEVDSGTELDLYALWGTQTDDIWVGGDYETLGHYDGSFWDIQTGSEGGGSFNIYRTLTGFSSNDIYAFGPINIFFPGGGVRAKISRYDGEDWTIATQLPDCSLLYASFADQTNGLVAAGVQGTVILGMGGTHWMRLTAPTQADLKGVWVDPGWDSLVTLGSGGTYAYLFDVDEDWTVAQAGTREDINAMCSIPEQPCWAVGADGLILEYGPSPLFPSLNWWFPCNSLYQGIITDIWGKGGDYRAVGEDGTVLGRDGGTWSVLTVLVETELRAVWGSSVEDYWVGGEAQVDAQTCGVLWHYQAGDWTGPVAWENRAVNGLWGLAGDEFYAACDRQTVARYNGSTWSYLTSSGVSSIDCYDVWGVSSDDLWACGRDTASEEGVLLHYYGGEWSRLTGDYIVKSLWGAGASSIWGAGWIKGTYYGAIIRYTGAEWVYQTSSPKGTFHSTWGSSGTDVWAVGGNPLLGFDGLVYHYDGGQWSLVTTPGDVTLFGVGGDEDGMAVAGLRGCVYSWGPAAPGSGPSAIGDYDGDGTSDPAVFRASEGLWKVRAVTRLYFGTSQDEPVPQDYDGDGTWDMAFYRRSERLWKVRELSRYYFGASDDVLVPGLYPGHSGASAAFFRSEEGLWKVRELTRFYFGDSGDAPVCRDYDGDGTTDTAFFRPNEALWKVRGLTRFYFGTSEDEPIPADYDGDSSAEAAFFRSSERFWKVLGLTRLYFGAATDLAVPGDYDGDGTDDCAFYRRDEALWKAREVTRFYFGQPADEQVTNPY